MLIAAVVPVVVGVRILVADWAAAAIVGLTVPLIPIFMILIGLYTQRDVRRQWRTLSVLGKHFLDLVPRHRPRHLRKEALATKRRRGRIR